MNVNTTKNKGYHLIFSCPVVEANQVLAARATIESELLQTFEKNQHKGILDASRSVVNDTKRVLIETRGEGGYILIPPSFGYKSVYGKLNVIKFQEYNELMEAARSFNEVYDSVKRGYSENEDLIEAKLMHAIKSLCVSNDNISTDKLKRYTEMAYLIGAFNTSGIDGLAKEIARLKKIDKSIYDILVDSDW
jgi:hypothetical protein